MKLKTKVARLLRKWSERLDPPLSLISPAPFPPLSAEAYNVERICIKLSYPRYMLTRHPQFDDVARNNMANKIASSLMSSKALIIDKNMDNDTIEYIGKLKVLTPL